MMTILAALGGLAWPLIKWALPGASAGVSTALGALLLAVVLIGGPAGAVWLHKDGQISGVREAEQHACEVRISENVTASALALADLLGTIRTAEADADEPKTSAGELALCKRSKLCRENRQ